MHPHHSVDGGDGSGGRLCGGDCAGSCTCYGLICEGCGGAVAAGSLVTDAPVVVVVAVGYDASF